MFILHVMLNSIRYTRQLSTDNPGGDLTSFSQITIEQCELKCDSIVYCVGFVFRNSTNDCWVKSELLGYSYRNSFDSYYKPDPQKPSVIFINTTSSKVEGVFDGTRQSIVFNGSMFGSLIDINKQYIQIGYLDTSGSTIYASICDASTWSDKAIIVKYPTLADLKDMYNLNPAFINVTLKNYNFVDSFIVEVDDATYMKRNDILDSPFSCFFGGESMKTDPFSRFIHMHSGEDLLLQKAGSNHVLFGGQNLYLNGKYGGNIGHRLIAANSNSSESEYLFIATSSGYLIYNSGRYLGFNYNVFSGYWYNQDIISVDISDKRMVYWNCKSKEIQSPSIAYDTFQTNLKTFDVDLLNINIFGNDFGNFTENSENYIDFEMIKDKAILKTDSSMVTFWNSTDISVDYPSLKDLKFYYALKPDSVNIIVHTTKSKMSLKLNVRIPIINTSTPFQCFHPDGRSWKIDQASTRNPIRLNAGAPISVQVDATTLDNTGGLVGLQENGTSNYLRHYIDVMYSNEIDKANYYDPLLDDFRYLPMVTNRGFVFFNFYQYYWGRYIGYRVNEDVLHTTFEGDPDFVFWNCKVSYEYSPITPHKTSSATAVQNYRTTIYMGNSTELKTRSEQSTFKNGIEILSTANITSLFLSNLTPLSTSDLIVSAFSVLRASISSALLISIFVILIKRQLARKGYSKKEKKNPQRSFNF